MDTNTHKWAIRPDTYGYMLGLAAEALPEENIEIEYTYHVTNGVEVTNLPTVFNATQFYFYDAEGPHIDLMNKAFGATVAHEVQMMYVGAYPISKAFTNKAYSLYAMASIYGENLKDVFTVDEVFSQDTWVKAWAWLRREREHFDYNTKEGSELFIPLDNGIILTYGNLGIFYRQMLRDTGEYAFIERTQRNVFIHTSDPEFANKLEYRFHNAPDIYTARVTDSDLRKYTKIINSML